MRFRLLDEDEEYNDAWDTSASEVNDPVSSIWVFPNDEIEYYPLLNGNCSVLYFSFSCSSYPIIR